MHTAAGSGGVPGAAERLGLGDTVLWPRRGSGGSGRPRLLPTRLEAPPEPRVLSAVLSLH